MKFKVQAISNSHTKKIQTSPLKKRRQVQDYRDISILEPGMAQTSIESAKQ